MKKFALLFVSFMALAGEELTLERAGADDLVATELTQTSSKRVGEMEASADPVSLSWALDPATPLDASNKAPVVSSKEAWFSVTGSDFQAGIALQLDHSGAMVRLSPATAGAEVPSLAELVLVDAKGRDFADGKGMKMFLDPKQTDVAKQTMFSEGTAVFRVDEKLGHGEVLLFADQMKGDAQDQYLVHVRENDSAVALTAQTSQHTYLAGQMLEVEVAMLADAQDLTLAQLAGEVVSPLGRRFPLQFRQGTATWQVVDGTEHPAIGLWEVQIHAVGQHGDRLVRRDLNTAFGVSEVTARFSGNVTLEHQAKAVVADLGVEVGVSGRYEVRGLLFGTDAQGNLAPIALGNSANWLEAGASKLSLSFDKTLLEKSGLQAAVCGEGPASGSPESDEPASSARSWLPLLNISLSPCPGFGPGLFAFGSNFAIKSKNVEKRTESALDCHPSRFQLEVGAEEWHPGRFQLEVGAEEWHPSRFQLEVGAEEWHPGRFQLEVGAEEWHPGRFQLEVARVAWHLARFQLEVARVAWHLARFQLGVARVACHPGRSSWNRSWKSGTQVVSSWNRVWKNGTQVVSNWNRSWTSGTQVVSSWN